MADRQLNRPQTLYPELPFACPPHDPDHASKAPPTPKQRPCAPAWLGRGRRTTCLDLGEEELERPARGPLLTELTGPVDPLYDCGKRHCNDTRNDLAINREWPGLRLARIGLFAQLFEDCFEKGLHVVGESR